MDMVSACRKTTAEKRQEQTQEEGMQFPVAGPSGDQSGDRGLETGSSQCEGDGQYRSDELIEPHSFLAEQSRQIDAVEEADQSG